MTSQNIVTLHERLARIEEKQESQGQLLARGVETIDRMDARLRSVEQKSTLFGGISGGIVSVGIALATAKLTGKA